MQKIEFEGQTYYFEKGKVYDGSFLEVPKIESQKVVASYLKTVNYKDMDEYELSSFLKDLKLAEEYHKCLEVIEYGLNKFTASFDFYKMVFPIITSCYRNVNQPQKAIDFWMANKEIFKSCLSTPLLTSLAAAYCDIKDYDKALYCANRAYAMQGGGQNRVTELTLVYERIQREMENMR
ncbi:MAG: hypothetical protein IJZ73_00295 [Clostridia bacterium]|nr:hypothetical protein [Clostridia bacterium]